MRNIIMILGVLASGCKSTHIGVQHNLSGYLDICIQYQNQEVEQNVLHILNSMTIVRHFNVIHQNYFMNEIAATCESIKDNKIDILKDHLRQTAGVFTVIISPH